MRLIKIYLGEATDVDWIGVYREDLMEFKRSNLYLATKFYARQIGNTELEVYRLDGPGYNNGKCPSIEIYLDDRLVLDNVNHWLLNLADSYIDVTTHAIDGSIHREAIPRNGLPMVARSQAVGSQHAPGSNGRKSVDPIASDRQAALLAYTASLPIEQKPSIEILLNQLDRVAECKACYTGSLEYSHTCSQLGIQQ